MCKVSILWTHAHLHSSYTHIKIHSHLYLYITLFHENAIFIENQFNTGNRYNTHTHTHIHIQIHTSFFPLNKLFLVNKFELDWFNFMKTKLLGFFDEEIGEQ